MQSHLAVEFSADPGGDGEIFRHLTCGGNRFFPAQNQIAVIGYRRGLFEAESAETSRRTEPERNAGLFPRGNGVVKIAFAGSERIVFEGNLVRSGGGHAFGAETVQFKTCLFRRNLRHLSRADLFRETETGVNMKAVE